MGRFSPLHPGTEHSELRHLCVPRARRFHGGLETMQQPESAATASLGVTQVAHAVQKQLRWLFRNQPEEDFGIDAHVELVEDGRVEGKLVALQIKTGASFFRERAEDGWWFRPDDDHVRYWTDHSLPVVLVLADISNERCYWQVINDSTLVTTSGGHRKVLVPEDHLLDESARHPLREAAQGDPYVLRIRELQLARPWMELLLDGKRLVIDIEEWINKSSGRGSIMLGVDREDGEQPLPLAGWDILLGLASYAEVVPRLFAWADVILHEETYDAADHDAFEKGCGAVDEEGDRFETEDFQEWASRRASAVPDLRPYMNEMGEVDRWRLELRLNELGRAFSLVDRSPQVASAS
jgi:hypothetical protein